MQEIIDAILQFPVAHPFRWQFFAEIMPIWFALGLGLWTVLLMYRRENRHHISFPDTWHASRNDLGQVSGEIVIAWAGNALFSRVTECRAVMRHAKPRDMDFLPILHRMATDFQGPQERALRFDISTDRNTFEVEVWFGLSDGSRGHTKRKITIPLERTVSATTRIRAMQAQSSPDTPTDPPTEAP